MKHFLYVFSAILLLLSAGQRVASGDEDGGIVDAMRANDARFDDIVLHHKRTLVSSFATEQSCETCPMTEDWRHSESSSILRWSIIPNAQGVRTRDAKINGFTS
jgi:hypothetical protein